MTDIVERLRGNAPKDCENCLWCEAADEIERLRRASEVDGKTIDEHLAEIERLREQLRLALAERDAAIEIGGDLIASREIKNLV